MDSVELLRELEERVRWIKNNPVSTMDGKKATRAQVQALLVQSTALAEISATNGARELAEEAGVDLAAVALANA